MQTVYNHTSEPPDGARDIPHIMLRCNVARRVTGRGYTDGAPLEALHKPSDRRVNAFTELNEM